MVRPFLNLDYRVLSCYREAIDLRNGLICHPRFAILYPTYACNHNCIGCDCADLRKSSRTMLTGEPFQHLLNEVINFGVRAVELCGGGEPLLHPQIDMAIQSLHTAGIRVGLLTNGTNISEQRAILLAKTCSYVRISIEAGTEEVFLRVKRPSSNSDSFPQVIENIRKILHFRKQYSTDCQVSLKYTIDQNNAADIENGVLLAEKLEVDSIQFKCIRNVPSEISDSDKYSLNEFLEGLKSRYQSLRIIGNLIPQPVKEQCWLSPLHVMIDPLGDVFLCCYYRHRFERHKYGNLFDRSLKEIWYSAEHQAALRCIRKDECEKYDCRFNRYAQIMNSMLKTGQLDFL